MGIAWERADYLEKHVEQIGIAGTGRMGTAIGGRLVAAGFELTVWNRTPQRAAALAERGARIVSTPRELAERCDIVLTLLTDDRALEAVYGGPDGLLSAGVAGKLFIEMSTVRSATVERLAAAAIQRGAGFVDAPVSGSIAPARAGQLLALVGGTDADVERARPVLQAFSRRVAHVGPAGSGTTMKLVLNMPMAVYWQGLSEALAMGAQAGLELATMLELIADSGAAIGALKPKIPQMLGQAGEVGFPITGVRKDLLAMVETGQRYGVPMPAGSAALLGFMAATAAGRGDDDFAAYVQHFIDTVRASQSEGAG